MGGNESGGGREEVSLRCPGCNCPMSRVMKTQRLTVKRREGDTRIREAVIRKLRECENCRRAFWTREIEIKKGT